MWSSPSHTNTSKIHLHVEQFSQTTQWKLAEELTPLQQKLQERFPCNEVGWQKDIQLRPPPREGSERKRRYTLADPLPGQQAGQATDWASQSWGPMWRTQASLAAGRTTGTDKRVEEPRQTLTPLVKSACVLACQQTWQREFCPGGCHLAMRPIQVRQAPWPFPFHITTWCRIWASHVLGKNFP